MSRIRKVLLGTLTLALISAVILWHSLFPKPMLSPVGLKISRVKRNAVTDSPATCSFTITNVTDRPVVVQAVLERLIGGEWGIIPCSLPGPMYLSNLLKLDVGETKSVILPLPADEHGDVTYRIGVDYWLRERGVRVWRENLRIIGDGLRGRKPPDSGLTVIGGFWDGTRIDWLARLRVNTAAWNGVQQKDAPNPAPALRFQFDSDGRGVGDPFRWASHTTYGL